MNELVKENEQVKDTSTKSSRILEQARLIAEQAAVPEQTILRKVNSLLRWLVIGLSGSALTLLVIKLDLFQGRGPRALVALVLLMCAASAAASVVGLLMLRGTAYALYYVRGLEEWVSDLEEAPLSSSSARRRRFFWLNVAAAVIPMLVVVNYLMVFGHNLLLTASWSLNLLGALAVLLALCTGVLFYKGNRDPRWASRYDKGFRLTIFSNDRAGIAFGGLMSAAVVAAIGLFGLHEMASANAVKLKQHKGDLEDVAIETFKALNQSGKIPESSVKEKEEYILTTRTEDNVVKHVLQPKGKKVEFIAEVTAEAGIIYPTRELEPSHELDTVKTRLVVGTVKEYRDKNIFQLVPDSNGPAGKTLEVDATDFESKPREGTRVVVAYDDPGSEPETYKAVIIEQIHTAGGGGLKEGANKSARSGSALRPTPAQASFNKGRQ